MEVVLIQGKEKTGKTTLCKMIETILITIGYEPHKDKEGNEVRISRIEKGIEKDFTAVYIKGKCTIIINSESEKGGIDRLKKIYKNNNLPYGKCTIVITAIRPKSENPNLNKWIKDIYKDDFEAEEHIVDLDIEKMKTENEELDFCEFIDKILKERGAEILKKIKKELKCEIEISCEPKRRK